MKREKKDHPVLFALKIGFFLLFVLIPIASWQAGWNSWTRRHTKRSEQ